MIICWRLGGNERQLEATVLSFYTKFFPLSNGIAHVSWTFKHAARRFLLGSVGGDLTHVKPAGKRSGQICGVWGERVWLVLCPYHVPRDYDGNGYSPAALYIEKSRG